MQPIRNAVVFLIASFAFAAAAAAASFTTKPQSIKLPAKLKALGITEPKIRKHVIRPRNLNNTVGDTGGAPPKVGRTSPTPNVTGRKTLNVAKFIDALQRDLQSTSNGGVIALRQGAGPVRWTVAGFAIRGGSIMPAAGRRPWTLDARQHVGSVSKTLTMMGMAKLLDGRKDVNYDSYIVNYLPAYWVKGPGVEKIRIRDLLTHQSGLTSGGSASDYLTMKQLVAQGTSGYGTYQYDNVNYGLFRIIISIITGGIDRNTRWQSPSNKASVGLPAGFEDSAWDLVTITAYEKYMQDNVFRPAGVKGATLQHSDGGAYAYGFPNDGGGWDSGDLSTMAGGAGWHLSAGELLDVMTAFRRKGTIVSRLFAEKLLAAGFGVNFGYDTDAGHIYAKPGYWSTQQGSGPEMAEQAVAFFLPDDTELVVLVNSPWGNPPKKLVDFVALRYRYWVR
jgi:CubicO group peptidase (beta-lactamase class C family)